MTRGSLTNLVVPRLDELVAAAAVAHGDDLHAAGLLVALSGGPDSVAMLDLATHWACKHDRPLVAAHINHQLRGDAADRDEDFCRDLCARLEVPLELRRHDVRAVARDRGRGLEEAARTVRQDILLTIMSERGLAAIATGHHRDDQSETVLMRLFRGTGLDGLRGIRARAGHFVRPLLAVSRAEVLAHLETQHLTWREDATNEDGSNTRGRVRRELLPLACDIFGEGVGTAPARLASLVEGDLAHLDALAEAAWSTVTVAGPADLLEPALHVASCHQLPPPIARRVIRRWLAPHVSVDVGQVHLDQVLRWFAQGQSGSSLDLPGPVQLRWVFDAVGIAAAAAPRALASDWRLNIEPLAGVPATPQPPGQVDGCWSMVCAADTLRGNLRLRHPRPGDRIQPFGLAGHKKLSDLVQEKRVPQSGRDELLVVEDDQGPLWVVGVVQAERTRLLPSTRQAVTISVIRRHRETGR